MRPETWTIPQLMAHRRRDDAAVQALVMDDRAIPWAELDDASRALAVQFVRDGVNK